MQDEEGLATDQAIRPEAEHQMAMALTNRVNTSSDIMVHVQPQEQHLTDDSDESDDNLWRNPESELQQSLPSHQFKALRALPSENTYKKSLRRSLRSKSPRLGGFSRGSMRDEAGGMPNEASNENEVLQDIDLSPEEFTELARRRRSLKEIPTTIRRKRSLRCDSVLFIIYNIGEPCFFTNFFLL